VIALPVFLAVIAAIAAAPLAQASAVPVPVATAPVPTGVPTPIAPTTTPAPVATPSAVPTPAAPPTAVTPPASTAPAAGGAAPAIVPASAAYQYRFVPSQPKVVAAGQPQIFAVYLNAKKLRSLGPIAIRVLTSTNVVKVTSSSNGRAGAVPSVAPGDFEANSKLPKLPFVASGITTTIDFIATSAAGKKVTVAVPVELL